MDWDNANNTRKRNWAFIVSPCIIAAIIFLGGIIYAYASMRTSEGWSLVALAFCLPGLFAALLIDIVLRIFLKEVKQKGLYIWMIEPVLMALGFIVFYYSRV
jgi:hypothetical protein